jgi:hypothetical protein
MCEETYDKRKIGILLFIIYYIITKLLLLFVKIV